MIVDQGSAVTAMRDATVRIGLQQIRALETLGSTAAATAFSADLAIEQATAQERLAPLEPWSALPDRSYSRYTRGANHVRLARLLDFIQPGDRILDIGVGLGYVTSTIMRTERPAYYCGVDLTPRYIEAAREGLTANGLSDAPVHLEVRDLYDIDAGWIQQHRPDLVLILEVLEHVSDPGAALNSLAPALGTGTTLLFTVPMLGRLEGVFGHRSVFDVARIMRLCGDAGLTLQHVEPLHNTWSLVLATPTQEVPSRLTAALSQQWPQPATLLRQYDFTSVDLSDHPDSHRREDEDAGVTTIRAAGRGLQCQVRSPADAAAPARGGLAFAAGGIGVLRLDLLCDDLSGVSHLHLDGFAAGERVARWCWALGPKRPRPGARMTHVVRAVGGEGDRLAAVGTIDAGEIDRFELSVQLDAGSEGATFTLARADYLSVEGPRSDASTG